MLLCFFCDLHLPYNQGASQYDAFRFFLGEIGRIRPDHVFFLGDYTADGDMGAAEVFLSGMKTLGVPYAVIPGNSDLRNAETADILYNTASGTVYKCGERNILLCNDSDGKISPEDMRLICSMTGRDYLALHHPMWSHEPETAGFLAKWRADHPGNLVFSAHLHVSSREGNDISVNAADPDKAMGEMPSMTLFDTETEEIRKVYFPCPMPPDFKDYFGISCYNPLSDVPYAAENAIPVIELRASAVFDDRNELISCVERWRQSGGKTLSVHMPDLIYENGTVSNEQEWEDAVRLANDVGADRVTVHVPKCSVEEAGRPGVSEYIASRAAFFIDRLPDKCCVGIENMHMTSKDTPGHRRFGYIPSEVLSFVQLLSDFSSHSIGCHIDVGHARNNAPFSQKYNLSSWYAEEGPLANGYHVHQVVRTDSGFVNHRPITDWYGGLISYASFFYAWSHGQLRKAPVILETVRETN